MRTKITNFAKKFFKPKDIPAKDIMVLYLTFKENENSRFYYVAVLAKHLHLFISDVKKSEANIEKYGNILKQGELPEPIETRDKMLLFYGCKHNGSIKLEI